MANANLSDLDARLAVIERLTKLFRPERLVHLIVTSVALVMLLANAALLLLRREAGSAELTLLFGSSGLITYSASRLLFMWNQSLRILAMQELEKSS